jgi:hypothetical protein
MELFQLQNIRTRHWGPFMLPNFLALVQNPKSRTVGVNLQLQSFAGIMKESDTTSVY